jgi:hypothetical protein
MDLILELFRRTRLIISVVILSVLICGCAKLPTGIARKNPCDPAGINWHPPVVTVGQDTTVSINDSVWLYSSATDSFGYITSFAWDIGNTGTFVTTTAGDTTIVAPASESLNYLCVLRVTDNDGNTTKDTIKVIVGQDVPVVNAGNDIANDTQVGMGDTIHLHGSAAQQFGYIVKWEWKIRSGSWITTNGFDTMVIMSHTEQMCICSLAVTDDDGNRGVDEIKIFNFDTAGMVAYWPFNEATDSVLFDGSLKGNTAFIHTATRVVGVKGNALSFNGISDYAHANNSALLNIRNKLSIECWVNVRQLASDQTIIRKDACYTFGIGIGGKIGFWVCLSSGDWQGSWALSQQTLDTSSWYHVAGVWDGAVLKVYVNGVADIKTMATSGGAIVSNSNNVYLGEFHENSNSRLNGIVDELRIYNYALPAATIAAHYNW